ncbi:MAG: exosortase E/protease, VPEID-CTERM system [Steroidobacterales bacterium]
MRRFGIHARVITIAVALIIETVLLSLLIQASMKDTAGIAALVHGVQHWLFRFLIAYAACWVILLTLRPGTGLASTYGAQFLAPLRLRWLVVHVALLVPLAFLSAALYDGRTGGSFVAVAVAWHGCGVGATIALFAIMAPLRIWLAMFRRSGTLALYAAVPALGAVLAIQWSQRLWESAATVTFKLVGILLRPVMPQLLLDPDTRVLGTNQFAVQIAEICSGLEGVSLMLVFCCAWLWYFRREFRFPRALLVIPVALVLVFLVNAVRIAAIVLIGDAGHEQLAMIGFHSQAGWIGFNLVAFGVAVVARRSTWLNRAADTHKDAASTVNPTTPYLLPFLALLAAGMLAHALSAGFELLYPLRLAAAGLALWLYRHHYRGLEWGFTWRGVAVGVAIFGVWIAAGRWLLPHAAMPQALSELSPPARALWISCRAIAAIVTVPMTEELAFRGYVLRRCTHAHFDTIAFSEARWPGLLLSSLLFGAMHGTMWLAGSIAGLAFGLVAMRTNRLGESVAAHATCNALIAVTVLAFGQWQWW